MALSALAETALHPSDGTQTLNADAGWLLCTVQDAPLHLNGSMGQRLLQPDQVFALRAGTEVSVTARQDRASLTILQLTGSAADAILADQAEDGFRFFERSGSAVRQFYRAFCAARTEQLPLTPEALSVQLYSLLIKLHSTAPQTDAEAAYPPLVREAIALMQTNYAYLDGVGDLADRLAVTPNHLIRRFTAAVGMSPGRYLTALRLEHAKQLLTDPDMNVQTAAEAAGFSCANYFIKVFRRATGVTPGQYAAENRAAPHHSPRSADTHYVL